MHRLLRLLIGASLLPLAACYMVSFEDVSGKQPYSHYIGKHYRAVDTAYVNRVSLDQNYKPTPSAYFLYGNRIATSGPEVLSHEELPIGTTFQVVKVMRCKDCFLDFGERIEAIVRITSVDRFNDAEVRVSANFLGTSFVEW